jgi:methionine synthase II (cobalamin-independent)
LGDMVWNCAATGIGSLPHQDPRRAVDLLLSHLQEVPYWPQLPALGFGENMYAQFSTCLPGVRIDERRKRIMVDLSDYDPEEFYMAVVSEDVEHFSHPKQNFHGLYALLDAAKGRRFKAVKGQVTGPVSAGLQVFDQNGKAAIYDEAYGEIIRRNLNMQAKWQAQKLRELTNRPIIFLDEPSLTLIGTPFASVSQRQVVAWIDEVLEGVNAIKGLHCCGNTDWPLVLSTDIDLLSFDAYNYAHTVSLFPQEISAFLESGGSLGWGLIPNMEEQIPKETVGTLLHRFEGYMDMLFRKGMNLDLVLERSLITPQCGLGGLDVPKAERVLELLNGTVDAIRARYRLGGMS